MRLICFPLRIGSMYGIFTYIWLIFFMVNVGKYAIHGYYGLCQHLICPSFDIEPFTTIN